MFEESVKRGQSVKRVKRKENIHWMFLAQEPAGVLEWLFLAKGPAGALAKSS